MYKLCCFYLVVFAVVFVNCEIITPHKISLNCTEFCLRIECEPVKECEGGFILEKGSYCGCCNACVKYLDFNEACSKILTGSFALVAQSRCKPGTECKNGKCAFVSEIPSECLSQKNIREKKKGNKLYEENIWIPQCDIHGNYKAKQKKLRKSICVDKSGKRIFGSASDSLENPCACSRYMLEKEKVQRDAYNTELQEHCSPSGSFAELQCIGNLCYCADDNTGQVISHLVTRRFLEKLPCYDKDSQTNNYLTKCETELQRSRKLVYDFKKKGMNVIGTARIKCDPDGTFSPVQCTLTKCICTNKEGVGIKSYHPDIERAVNMTCDCAREEIYEHNTMFRCTESGDYYPSTCAGNHCFCVDNDGDIISKELTEKLKEDKEKICDNLRQDISEYPEDNNNDGDGTTIDDNSDYSDYSSYDDY